MAHPAQSTGHRVYACGGHAPQYCLASSGHLILGRPAFPELPGCRPQNNLSTQLYYAQAQLSSIQRPVVFVLRSATGLVLSLGVP
jgi:hypothetical protein